MSNIMIPIGYMYKRMNPLRSPWLGEQVVEICTLGDCGGNSTNDFVDYQHFWAHNGYWLFNTPAELIKLANSKDLDLNDVVLFYYEAYENEFDFDDEDNYLWTGFSPEPSFVTAVERPVLSEFLGFDVVEYVIGNHHECSLLACSDLAQYFQLNQYCLFQTLEEAKSALESGKFHEHEPGPYRIIGVYRILHC